MARVTGATLHTQATVAITRVVIKLQEVLGQRLTAVVAGTKDARTLRAWAQGQRSPSVEAERRLRDAYAVVDLLLEVEAPETVRAWFCGMNPNLDDRPPVLALATMPQEVLQAARAFVPAPLRSSAAERVRHTTIVPPPLRARLISRQRWWTDLTRHSGTA